MLRRWGLALIVIVGMAVLLYCFTPAERPKPDPLVLQPSIQPKFLWTFESPRPGGFVAAPTIVDDTVYLTALHARGFRYAGAVYALNLNTGRVRWTFHDDDRMKPSAARPIIAGSRLFVGEGMHADFVCQFRALDTATGQQLWRLQANDHIEAAARVHEDTVYFSAGNDGVYAVQAKTGQLKWHFAADVHTDAQPCLHQGQIIVGTGPSRRFSTQQVVALRADTGVPSWRVDVALPAWGSPVAVEDSVFLGLGNGRMMTAAEKPAGALLCLNVKDGSTRWQIPTADAVFQQPTPADQRVYFASRDGILYCVEQTSGKVIFTRSVGSPMIASPTVTENTIYTLSVPGLLRQLDRNTGEEYWSLDLAKRSESQGLFLGSVQVVGSKLVIAGELVTPSGSVAVAYCLKV